MIEMSVDKETLLLSNQSADASLPLQQSAIVSENDSECVQRPIETTKDDGPSNVIEPALVSECSDRVVAACANLNQNQNGVQQPKPSQPHQQRLNKRRSTMNSGFKSPVPNKRRRRANSESESVLPSNFLLGGNIFDPLNLNSLLDEEVNRALNAETPKSSPLPSKSRDPVEILIPKDITDPLNLNSCMAGDTGILLSPLKSSGGRRRHRNRHHGGAGGVRGGTGREAGSVDCVGGSKGGEGPAIQRNQMESETFKVCLASQSESTLASFVSGGKEDRTDPKGIEEEVSGSNILPNEEVLDESARMRCTSPVAHASHRQRKRRRSTSRSENTGASSWEKNKPAAPGPAFGSGQLNHKGQQKSNNQKPNQHQHQKNFNQHRPNQQRKKFQYGNYNQYYGYRNPGACEDVRVRVLRPEWFRGKEVLDLGCNTGHLTLTIAKTWRPTRIVGLDIDSGLIHAAKQNIRHYLSEVHALQSREGRKEERAREEDKLGNDEANEKITEDKEEENTDEGKMDEEQLEGSNTTGAGDEDEGNGSAGEQMDGDKKTEDKKNHGGSVPADGSCLFPLSLRVSRGPIAAPPLPDTQALPLGDFPSNVTFVKGNYVLDSDALLQTQREEFDVILCLSVTKWVHLNWGDAGLKRFFHRAYRHLRPGGLFILEPQPWSSYSKRKKLTDNIYKNYFSIQLKPDKFSTFLTGEVGFSSYELLGTPNSSSRGFQRPIYLFHKGPTPRK